jgi:hypothetical protein
MKLLIKFPTRNRPNKFLKTLVRYVDYLDDKTTKIVVTCDNDDITMKDDYIKEVVLNYGNVELLSGNHKSKIEAVNADLDKFYFDIVLLASDDMIPMVKGYDTIIKNKMIEHYPDTDGVLWFNDGYQGNKLNTLSIMGKKYYDRFNYIYSPDYLSVWCDNEFMDVAGILNKQIYFDEVIIKHEHPDWGFGGRDDIHTLNSKHEAHDRMVYTSRKNNNFYL